MNSGFYVLLFCAALLRTVYSAVAGDIEFELTGIPDTWDGPPNGMAQPRDSPTSEIDIEFVAEASSYSYSIVHAATTAKSMDDDNAPVVPLSKYDGFELDMWIMHKGFLWPCVAAEGKSENLHIRNYDSDNYHYIVNAAYVVNDKNEYFFNSTLSVVAI
jgi:hypothetical protein